ncbi:MAG: ThiF family adenylyltransferase, partial [Nitrospinota bacterium]
WEPEGEGAKELPPLFLPAEGASWGEAFRRQLGALNPDVEVTTSQGGQPGPLIEGCALALLGVWDEARAELAEAFWRVGKPALAGEAKGWRGWAAVALPGGPCPRCLAARGVEFLPPGTAPGPEPCAVTVGSLLALEAMKVLLDIGESRRGSLYRLDLWDLRLEREEPPGEAGCSSCGAGTGGGAERPTPKKETS